MTSTTKLSTTTAFATALFAALLPTVAQATDYKGAVLLRGEDDVTVEGVQALDASQEAYYSWQGDTLFAGATDPVTGNQVSMLAEFYWFETSLDRRADFYTVLLKVKTSPKTDSAWELDVDGGEHWYNPDRTFSPTQELVVDMDPSGAGGAIRWDWCAPFTDYKFEPMRTVNIQQGYSLGLDTEGSVTEELKGDGTKAKIVGKGSFDAHRKVSSNYTMTLFAWQMFVTGGAERMGWKLGLTDGERSKQSAYHEYVLVVQAARGRTAEITSIEFAGNMREDRYARRDNKQTVAALLRGIRITPPSAEVLADRARRANDESLTGNAPEGSGVRTSATATSGTQTSGTQPAADAAPAVEAPATAERAAECDRSSDCAEGRICSRSGMCINECETARDCGAGATCEAGRCERAASDDEAADAPAAECAYDRDCDAHELCSPMGVCVAECRADRDCPSSMACDAGACVAGTNQAFIEGTTTHAPAAGGCSTTTTGSNATAVFATALLMMGLAIARRRNA